jgi:exonuclease SbcD
MYSFAHLSDTHIGAFRQPVLQNLVIKAFSKAIDICIERKVDFVVVSGDLFDSNIPDMALANSAVRKIREARDRGIQFYVVYGSHDFSPTQTSIVDLLESAGLFKKVTKGKIEEGKLVLEFHTDERTKAKLCGISGRRLGIEKEYFEILNREDLEREKGFKIFVFHGAVSEYKPEYLAEAESVPLSTLPKGFGYYAGGHIHEKFLAKELGYNIAYPGTLIGADFRDLEKNAKGQERGLFIVTFSEKVENIEFVPISVCDYELIEYDANGKNAVSVQNDLLEIVGRVKPAGKLVLVKVAGVMSGGKTADIDFQHIRRIIKDRGALEVFLNYQKLSSKEYAAIKVAGEDVHEIEDRLFKENIGKVKVSDPKLKGESGIKLSRELLNVLKEAKKENEAKSIYESRIISEAVDTLRIKEAFG